MNYRVLTIPMKCYISHKFNAEYSPFLDVRSIKALFSTMLLLVDNVLDDKTDENLKKWYESKLRCLLANPILNEDDIQYIKSKLVGK